MRILGPERTRRALWLMYTRLTSTPLHTAYTLVLLLSSITLLSLHLASLTNTHISLSKLVTLLNIARPDDSSVIVPTFSNVDGQPVLQLCNVGQSDCQIVTSASPTSRPSPEAPQQADGGVSSPVPTTTAQQSNAEITPFPDVGVQGNGVVSVSSVSTTSSTSSVASPLSSASSTSSIASSSSSSSGLFIADVGVSTTASSASGSAVASSSVLVEPTLVLLGPSTNATTRATSTSTSQTTRAIATSEPVQTTTTVERGQPDNASPPPTTRGRPTETSTQAQTTSETTSTETTTSATTTTTAATDVVANDLSLSTSTTQTVPELPTAAELTTTAGTEISGSQTATISSSLVPEATEGASIQVIPPAARSRVQISTRNNRPPVLGRRAFSAVPVLDSANGSLSGIDVTDVEDDGGSEVTRLNVICALATAFPEFQLQQSQMEDLVLIVFYVWLAGIGLAAIINESTPHLITVFLSSIFALLWSGTQILRTRALRAQFDAFITHGACDGVNVLPSYWTQRERLEIPTVVINALAVLVFAGMSLGLLKKYHKKTRVNRYVYNVILVLRTAILLGMFFLGAASVLWVQQLFSATASAFTSTLGALRIMGILSIVLAIPLGAMGWWALKVEERSGQKARWVMAVFVVLDLFFVAQWTATFASDVYREVFTRWTFFAVVSVGGFFLLVGSLGAGVICWMRFGRALVRGSAFSEKLASEAGHARGNSAAVAAVNMHDDFDEGGIIPQIREIPWDYTNSGAERAWEPFDRVSVRQSQFTTSDADRQSTAFSYGLRSPVPPVPNRVGSFDSRMS